MLNGLVAAFLRIRCGHRLWATQPDLGVFLSASPRCQPRRAIRTAQRPPGLYTERPWRRTAGLDPGSVRRLDNERWRVAFHGADQ